ncbi:MAG: DMT family transporter [Chloroflexi bacterium]|nr:DMT family transporter [Chloroflexota bacterium]
MNDRNQRDGTIFILLSATGYSFFAVWVKNIQTTGLGPLDIGFWRFLIAAPLFWLVVFLRRTPPAQRPLPRLGLLVMGFFLALAALTAFFGLELIPANTFIVLFYTYPAMVAVFSLFLGDRLPPVGWLALALTIVGIALTVPDFGAGLSGDNLLGVVLALVNALVVAIYFILSSRLLRGHTAMARASVWSISGTFFIMAATVPFRTLQAPADATAWMNLLALATISTVMPVFALNSGIQKVGAARAAIIGTIEPIQTLLWTFLLLGEQMQPTQVAGGALILGSIILLQAQSLLRTRALRREVAQNT